MYNKEEHDILKSLSDTYKEDIQENWIDDIGQIPQRISDWNVRNNLGSKKYDKKTGTTARTDSDGSTRAVIQAPKGGKHGTMEKGRPETWKPSTSEPLDQKRYNELKKSTNPDATRATSSSTTTPKVTPTPTATPKPTATTKPTATKPSPQTGDKAKDMAAWAKANPKLAANKAERDRTRGTSSSTNPLMKSTFGAKHVSSMPKAAPKPAVSTAPKPAVTAPKPVQPAKAVKPLKPVTAPKPPTLTKSSVSEAVELFEAAKKREPRGKTKTFKVNVIARGAGGRTELIKAVNPTEARKIAASRFGGDTIGSVNTQARQYKD